MSGEDLGDHFTVNVGQAAIDPVLTDGKPLVINAHQVQQSRVKIVTVRFSFDGLVTPLVAVTVCGAWANARAREPGNETAAIVIAPK